MSNSKVGTKRYCQYKTRKSRKRPSMETEEVATDSKLKKFLADVEKFSERSKQRKEKRIQQYQVKSIHFNGKKGLFENGLQSKSTVKGILGFENLERLKGNLDTLINKENENETNSIDPYGENSPSVYGSCVSKSYKQDETVSFERMNQTETKNDSIVDINEKLPKTADYSESDGPPLQKMIWDKYVGVYKEAASTFFKNIATPDPFKESQKIILDVFKQRLVEELKEDTTLIKKMFANDEMQRFTKCSENENFDKREELNVEGGKHITQKQYTEKASQGKTNNNICFKQKEFIFGHSPSRTDHLNFSFSPKPNPCFVSKPAESQPEFFNALNVSHSKKNSRDQGFNFLDSSQNSPGLKLPSPRGLRLFDVTSLMTFTSKKILPIMSTPPSSERKDNFRIMRTPSPPKRCKVSFSSCLNSPQPDVRITRMNTSPQGDAPCMIRSPVSHHTNFNKSLSPETVFLSPPRSSLIIENSTSNWQQKNEKHWIPDTTSIDASPYFTGQNESICIFSDTNLKYNRNLVDSIPNVPKLRHQHMDRKRCVKYVKGKTSQDPNILAMSGLRFPKRSKVTFSPHKF